MKFEPTTIFSLMEDKAKIFIPIYQRNYSWDETDCNQMWQDLHDHLENKYFFGTLICKEEEGNIRVVDGQQRITTFSLLLLAIKKNFPHIGDIKKIDGCIYCSPDDDQNIKLKQVDSHAKHYREIVFNNTEKNDENRQSQIFKNFWSFEVKTKQESEEKIKMLLNALKEYIEIIVMYLEPEDKAQIVYEKLNATGKTLLESDKIRNNIFMSIPESKQREMFNMYWIQVEKNTNNSSSDINDFLLKFLSLEKKTDIVKSDIFKTFKTVFSTKLRNDGYEDVLKRLKKFSRYYYLSGYIEKNLEDNEQLKYEDFFADFTFLLENRQTTQITYFMSILECYDDGKMEKEEVVKVFDFIKRYYATRQIKHIAHQGYNKMYTTLHRDVLKIQEEKGCKYIEALSIHFFEHVTDAKKAIKKSGFENSIIHVNFYRLGHMFMRPLANEFQHDTQLKPSEKYHIEHIMPRNKELWVEELDDSAKKNFDEMHEKYVDTVGNLTILRGEDNRDISNAIFGEKKKVYKKSNIKITQELCQSKVWNEEEILKRSEKFKKIVIELWGLHEYEDIYEKVKE